MPEPSIPSEAALGRRLRALREAAKLQQQQVAQAMRRLGLPWTQATVAFVENGTRGRSLSLRETVALLRVFNAAGVAGVPGPLQLSDLLPEGDVHVAEPVACAPVRTALGQSLQEWMEQYERYWWAILGRGPSYPVFDPSTETFSTPVDPAPAWVDEASLGDAEQKAARVLRVPAVAVVLCCWRLWKTSLTTERDRRVAAQAEGASPRSLQALRGHTTRELLGQLRPLVAGLKIKRPRKGR